MRIFIFIITLMPFFWCQAANLLPEVDARDPQFSFNFRTDLWTSTSVSKESPVRIYQFELHMPIIKSQNWVSSIGAGIEGFSSGLSTLVVGKNQTLIGSDLRQQYAGAGFNHKFDSGSETSYFLSYNSASDEPFRDGRDQWAEFTGIYYSPNRVNGRWLFAVNQSQNRGYLNGHPVPYFGYIFNPNNPQFSFAIGFPFLKFNWLFDSDWAALLDADPMTQILTFRKAYNQNFNFRFRYGLTAKSYLHVKRLDDQARLYFEEKFAETGFMFQITEITSCLFVLGGSYDRGFYESSQIREPNSKKTTLPADFYGRLRFEFLL